MGDESGGDPYRDQYAQRVQDHQQLLDDTDAASAAVRQLRDDTAAQGHPTTKSDQYLDALDAHHDQLTQVVQEDKDNLALYDQMTDPNAPYPTDASSGAGDESDPYADVPTASGDDPYADASDSGADDPYADTSSSAADSDPYGDG